MIFIAGGRGGGFGIFILLFSFLLIAGSGRGAGPLLFLLFFLGLPFLLFRAMARSATSVRVPDPHSREAYPYPHGAQPPGWDLPQQPVLPPVNAADVSSLRDRLGHDVRSLEPGDDPVSRQAMADASERYSTASTLLERASSDAQLRTAWLAAVEGLAATRTVRQRLGLDLGPPVPSLPGSGEQLTRHARVEVGGRGHVGAPHYEPGRPHYFPGGYYGRQHIPGGWYDAPFWPSALVLGGLAGWTLGGLTAGAMYGEDLGYGMDGGLDGGLDGGGDWSGGAGEWGGGGGDWSGGAGEWGGGGGGWSGGGSDWGGGGGGGDFGGGGDW